MIHNARQLPAAAVFDRADLRALGWSDQAISRACRGGRLIRVRHGQLARPAEIGPVLAAIAATRACAGSVVSHRSALLLYGLPVVGPEPPLPEITVSPTSTGSMPRAHLHRATIDAVDCTVVGTTPVTTVARTLVDVARHHSTALSVAALDAALHRGLVGRAELEAVVLRCWNWPGIRRVHRVLDLADGRTESPLESASRLVLHWARLPVPTLQPVIRDRRGVAIARLDFYWDEFGVAGEADGRSKYDARAVLTAEKERQEAAEDLGIVFARWGWREVRRPQELRDRIRRAFERGRARDRSGFPRRWSVEPS